MGGIILASGSPRRSEILNIAGIHHITDIPDIDETIRPGAGIRSEVVRLAIEKARTVFMRRNDGIPVLAADTVVVFRGEPLGKPPDRDEALRMLKILSGRWHKVITGYCIIISGEDHTAGYVTTRVRFRHLKDGEAESYVSSGEPFDKAGGYGIQSLGSRFVERIDGCYFNVMGLPVSKIFSILKERGIDCG